MDDFQGQEVKCTSLMPSTTVAVTLTGSKYVNTSNVSTSWLYLDVVIEESKL